MWGFSRDYSENVKLLKLVWLYLENKSQATRTSAVCQKPTFERLRWRRRLWPLKEDLPFYFKLASVTFYRGSQKKKSPDVFVSICIITGIIDEPHPTKGPIPVSIVSTRASLTYNRNLMGCHESVSLYSLDPASPHLQNLASILISHYHKPIF